MGQSPNPDGRWALIQSRGEIETFWATDRGDGTYQVKNILMFGYNLSIDGIVTVSQKHDNLWVKHVVQKSGHQTTRAIFPADSTRRQTWLPRTAKTETTSRISNNS